jgi:uncharacterized protein (TIGR04255 family)
MARIRPLAHPPITEAVIDLLVRFPEPMTAKDVHGFKGLVADAYPLEQARANVEVRVDANAESVGIERVSDVVGYLFRTRDGKQVVQSKRDGFSYNRLAPYHSWEQLIDEGWRLWELYNGMFKPLEVARLSTRFINRIELPSPPVDFDDYLSTMPKIPEGAPQRVAAFSARVTIPEIRKGTRATVTLLFDGVPPEGSKLPVLLDIDVHRECTFAPSARTEILEALHELRTVKNELFFGSITEKTAELFE